MPSHPPLLFLFTDFGLSGPYLAQLKTVLLRSLPTLQVLDLVADAPVADPDRAGCLLAALTPFLPTGAIVIAVVDPGVGGPRDALMIEADGRQFIGPDNGLLARIANRAIHCQAWRVDWRPDKLFASFHGRDLFAPMAVSLVDGSDLAKISVALDGLVGADWPDQLHEIIYLDHYGNAFTGISAAGISRNSVLRVGGRELKYARTFSDMPVGQAFWYPNSQGLVEIAINQGAAARELGLALGQSVQMMDL